MISFKFYKLDLKLLGFLKSGANMFKFTRHNVSLFLIGQKNEKKKNCCEDHFLLTQIARALI